MTHAETATLAGVRGQLAGGVTIVIAYPDGEPHAATATAVTVASLSPPLVTAFFGVDGRIHAALARSRRFTVNLLPEGSERLARHFGRPGRPSGWAGFAGVDLVHRDGGPPVLAAAIAWVDCEVVGQWPVGDHSCFVGQVLALGRQPGRDPLLHYRGRFHRLAATQPRVPLPPADPSELAVSW